MARKKKKFLFAATWNVRSLVESSGDIRVCRAARFAALNGGGGVDRKLDFLVDELGKYRVNVAGPQETKWFGSDVWRAGGSTLLHSGRPVPGADEPCRRNEGVGILLNACLTAAWKRGGEQWRAASEFASRHCTPAAWCCGRPASLWEEAVQ